MKHFLLFIFLFLISVSDVFGHIGETFNVKSPFKITGKVDDTTIKTFVFKYIRCENDESMVIDTIPVINGTFIIEGVIPPRTDAFFFINDNEVHFYLDPGEMQLYLKKDSLKNSVLSGSQTDSDRAMLQPQTDPLQNRFYEIGNQLSSEENEQNNDFLIRQKDSIQNILDNLRIDFISSHPTSYYSLDMIARLIDGRKQNTDVLTNLFDGLSENVRTSCFGKIVYGVILQRKKSTMSNISSLGLESVDKDGKLIKLSDFEGKYILIDYWASWCSHCIEGFPHLKELYAKYKDKGLIIIGISIDRKEDEQQWLNSIEKNGITEWVNILCCKYKGEDSICDLHESIPSPIPHYILIDKSGNVIKQWRGFGDTVIKEQDEMFERIFENKN